MTKAVGSAGSSSCNAIQLAQADNLNATVHSNLITHPATAVGTFRGIYVFGGTGHKVYNNVIRDVRAETGASATGIQVRTASTSPEVYFNTIDLSHSPASTTVVELTGIEEELSNTGVKLYNNLVNVTQPSATAQIGFAFATTTTINAAVFSNNNVFWVPGGNVAARGTTLYPTLASWQAAGSQDGSSLETIPYFQTGTAIPTSGIINNKGTSIPSVTTDIVGAARTASPDPGAYEFTPLSIDAALSRFVPPAYPHCAENLDVQFELTNVGNDPLTSATINWIVNGIVQPAVNWTGSLASGASTIVMLGKTDIAGGNVYQFSATVSNPNGMADGNPANNTQTYGGFRAGMSGNFTINAAAAASASNYTNFQSLANDLSAYGVCGPVKIDVLNGPYTAQVVFDSIPGANAAAQIVISGNNQLLSYPTNATGNDHVIKLNNVDYVTIEDLQVKSTDPTNGRAIFITNGSSFITINRCSVEVSKTATGSTSFGIIASGVNYLLNGSFVNNLVINGNTIIGGYVGIQVTGEELGLVEYTTITDNILLDQYAFGIQTYGIKDVSIAGNDISRPTRTNSGSYYGIGLSFRSNGFNVDRNKIHHLQNQNMSLSHLAGGITISGTTVATSIGTVSNNLIHSFTNTSTQYGINDASWGAGSSISIYHNTIALNYSLMTGAATTSAITLSASSTPTGSHDIKNNILYISRGGSGTSANKRLIDVASANTSFTSDYNVFAFETSEGNRHFGRIASNNYSDFATWQGLGKDVHSVNANPIFFDTASLNYRPNNGAIRGSVLGTSTVGGITTDILRLTRTTTPDPGAYEFAQPLPVRLLHFVGLAKNDRNNLTWQTATETANKGFEVQHSKNGTQFTTLSFVGSKAVAGNSSQKIDYEYDHYTPLEGDNYYRLMQIDINGHKEYSDVVLLRNEKNRLFVISSIYPNPVGTVLKAQLSVNTLNKLRVAVTNMEGKMLLQKTVDLAIGTHIVQLPVVSLAAGTYLLNLTNEITGERISQKFIKE